MGEAVFKINGVDFLPFTMADGIKIIRNDVDSDDSGEMLDGTIRRDRVIMRRRIEVQLGGGEHFPTGFTTSEINTINNALWPEFVDVEFLDPFTGNVITREFYISTVPTTTFIEIDDKVMWRPFSFNMIEKGVPL
jgi:hypothetical protein